MSADLPQQRGASDLAAAAQLRAPRQQGKDDVIVRPDPLMAAVRLDGLVEDWQLAPDAAGYTAVAVVESPEVRLAVECRCAPGVLCDEDGCAYCRDLDPSLPCPHDTFGDDQVDEAGASWSVQLLPGDGCTDCDGWGLDDAEQPCRSCVGTGRAVLEVPGPSAVHVVTIDGRPLHWRAGGHDERSAGFGVRDRMLSGTVPLHDFLRPVGPILDQGAEGECVGCGVVDATNSLRRQAGSGQLLTIDDAATIYRRAQQLDDRPGEGYVGTSVLAGLQAGVEAGLFGGYVWAFGTRDIAQAVLQVGPVIIGIPWLSGMSETGPGGLVIVQGEDQQVGHVLTVVGIRMTGPQDQPGPFFVWQNSWGDRYGDRGLGYIHHRDLAGLLHQQGEAAIPTVGPQH